MRKARAIGGQAEAEDQQRHPERTSTRHTHTFSVARRSTSRTRWRQPM
jgi:hypothetical protein